MTSSFAQETEVEIKASADKLFESEKYVEATSLYLRLLALSPRSHEYNFKYGTCLLFNSYKKQDAFKYLNYSVTDPNIDAQAFYFLGKAHHLNYQFNEAIKNYEAYKQKAGSKPNPAFDVNRQIEMCQNGKRLLTTITDLVVIEKKEYEAANFFRLYDLKNIGGEIIVAANFQSKIDKKKNHVPLIHFPAKTSKVFYASYGESDEGNKDIYVRNKLPDGSWSLPQKVNGAINTAFDEDFPYMHPGGEYMYFSSKGHNSMGGYDVYRSKYDAENNSFGPPENMDFAVSSPDNDLFYIVDSLDQNAYFASSRQSTNGKMFVYKVRVDRVPLQLAIIKGDFSSKINPENKKITITVTDYASGDKIGSYTSTDKGKYLITLPKGGKYAYEMVVEGNPTVHKYLANIPFQKEFKPLKQRISHESLDNQEVVRVTDLFNEEVEDPQSVLAEVIKQRSELNVNVQQFNLEELNALKENEKILAELGLENASPQEINNAFEKVKEKQEAVLQANENLLNGALNNSMENLARADKLQQEAKNLVATTANEADDKVKLEKLKEAQEKMNAADQLKEEVRSYLSFADSISKVIPEEQKKYNELKTMTEKVAAAVQNNDMAAVKEAVVPQSELIKATNARVDNPIDPLVETKTKLQKEVGDLSKQLNEYKQSEQAVSKEIAQLEAELKEAKTKDQPEIQGNIDRKKEELRLVSEEKARLEKKVDEKRQKELQLDQQIAYIQNVSAVTDKKVEPTVVKSKLEEVDTKNARSLDAYIDQQVAELSKTVDPANTNNTVTSNGNEQEFKSIVSDITEMHDEIQTDQETIDKAADMSEEQKLIAKNGNDKKLLKEIDKQLATVKAELAKNPTNKEAQTAEKELLALENETQQQVNERTKRLDAISQSNEAQNPTPEGVVKEIFPEYKEQKLAARESNPENQLQALNNVDKTLLTKIDQELKTVEEQLVSNPENKALINKQQVLKELKSTTQGNIENRENAIAQMNNSNSNGTNGTNGTNNSENNNTAEALKAITPEKELTALMPNYTERMTASGSTTSKEQLLEQNEIEQQLIDIIDDALTDLKAETPTEVSKKRIEVLEQLKATKQDAIADRSAKVKDLIASEEKATTLTETEVQNNLSPNYEQALANATTAKDKSEVDKALVEKATSRLETLKASEQSPAVVKESQLLQNIIDQADTRIKERETEKDVAKEVIAEIRPKYQTNIEKINASSLTEEEKELNRIKEEQALLDAVTKQINANDAALVKDPSKTDLATKNEELKEFQAIQEAKVNEQTEDLVAIKKAAIKPEVLQQEIFPEYQAPNMESNSFTDAEKEELVAQEKTLQAKLIKTIKANDKKLAANFNPDLAAENKVLAELMDASNGRITAIEGKENTQPIATDPAIALKENLGDDFQRVMKDQPSTLEANATTIEEVNALRESLVEKQAEFQAKSPDSPELKAIESQLELVNERALALKGNQSTLEQTAQNTATNISVNNTDNTNKTAVTQEQQALASLQAEEKRLQETLANGTPAEQKAVQKELTKNQEQQAVLQEKVNAEALNDIQKERQALTAELKTENTPLSKAVEKRIDQQITGSTNDNTNEQLEKENQAISLLEATKSYNDVKAVVENDGVIIATPEILAKQKRRFSIEIGQIEAELKNPNNDAGTNATLIETKLALTDAIKAIEEMERDLAAENTNDPALNAALTTNVTYKEEVELAANPSYSNVYKAKQEVNEARATTTKIAKEMEAVRQEIAASSDPKAQGDLIAELKQLSNELKQAQADVNRLDAIVAEKVNSLPGDKEKWNSLLARDVAPVVSNTAMESLAPIVANGFKIGEDNTQTIRPKAVIPIGLETPSGLVYRVQVGAFAKPIREDLFKEFTPVTGEKLDNGITRYLAGYFGERAKGLDAQTKIRNLGYADAFLVAYCDGKRISLAEAKRLEEQGLCVPKKQEELVMELVENTLAAMPADSAAKYQPVVKPSDYNKGPGAALASAVEEKQGLFFTVQVGVYNKPVPAEQLKNITPLVTKRLENGQIRYSSGMFHSIAAARPKKAEAVERGITDAFITAYYKGERISLDEAKRILAENGEGVLEKDTAAAKIQSSTIPVTTVVENQIIEQAAEPVQLVSETTFNSFPKEDIQRLNAYGTFYYDTLDKHIKSVYYPSKKALPVLADSQYDFDTLTNNQSTSLESEPKSITVVSTWADQKMSAAGANWILRYSSAYRAITIEKGVQITFEVVNEEEAEDLKERLERYGASTIAVENSQE